MRQFAPLLVVPIAVALMVIGYEQYSVTEYLFGDPFRPRGSLGLALMVTGLAIGYWSGIALVQPSWFARLGARLRASWRSPRRLFISGAVLSGIGLGMFSVTDQAGGAMVYHPYDYLGLEIVAVALGFFAAGARRLVSRAPPGGD